MTTHTKTQEKKEDITRNKRGLTEIELRVLDQWGWVGVVLRGVVEKNRIVCVGRGSGRWGVEGGGDEGAGWGDIRSPTEHNNQ